MAFAKGHPRYGGMKKGQKIQATIDKEHYRELLRQLVVAQLEPMVQAQIDHAKGVNFMMLRQNDGTFTRATDEAQIDAAGAIGESAFKVTTQTPNTQAFMALLDRALDRPKEQPQELEVRGTLNVVDVLKQRHGRRQPKS